MGHVRITNWDSLERKAGAAALRSLGKQAEELLSPEDKEKLSFQIGEDGKCQIGGDKAVIEKFLDLRRQLEQ